MRMPGPSRRRLRPRHPRQHERSRFIDELEQLARLVAFRPDLRMELGPPGSNWSYSHSRGTVHIDGGRIDAESRDFNRGLVMHECAHAAITRLHDMVPPAVLRSRPFFALLNAVEDCRIETWMQRRFPGCQSWVKEYNDILFGPMLHQKEDCPPIAQFLNGILSRWWFGKSIDGTLPEVATALEAVWPAMEEVIEAIPPEPHDCAEAAQDYPGSLVSRCYSGGDSQMPPDAYECAIRLAQFRMWSIVHARILPEFTPFIPTPGRSCDASNEYLARLFQILQRHHLLGSSLAGRQQPSHTPTIHFMGRAQSCAPLGGKGLERYMAARQSHQEIIEKLADEFLRRFHKNGRSHLRAGYTSGVKLDLRVAMQFEADPRVHDRLWIRRSLPHRVHPHFALVIDRSGSMEGERIQRTFEGVVILCEVCRRVGIPLQIHAFACRGEMLLNRDEALSDAVCARLGCLPESATGGTNLAEGLLQARQSLKGMEPEGYVVVLSDGEPADESAVRAEVVALERLGCRVLGLGLGPGTAGLAGLIPSSRVNLRPDQLPSAMASLLVQAGCMGSPSFTNHAAN